MKANAVVTVRTAADRLGWPLYRVRRAILRGDLRAFQPEGGRSLWLIDPRDLGRYEKAREKGQAHGV